MECKTLSIQDREICYYDRLLLTANRRLANYHQDRFNLEQVAQNKSSWENPKIAPLKSWLTELWHDHCQGSEILLSDLQEQEVWQGIIKETQSGLLDTTTTVQLAMSAYESLKLWNFDLNEIPPSSNEQVAQFLEWANEFEKIGEKNHWRNFAQIITELRNTIAKIPLPKEISLDGFDDLPPAYREILNFDPMDPSSSLPLWERGRPTTVPKKILLADSEAEIWAMARWAKMQVDKNPHINIGCIIPDLAQARDRVEFIFTKVFSKHLMISRTDTRHLFNLSAGANLISYEIIRIAKAALGLIEEECELEKLGTLLQSPYLCAHESDAALGAHCHAALLERGAQALPLSEIFSPLSQYFELYPQNTWLPRLRKFSEHCKDLSARSPHEWSLFFNEALEALGWPGERTLDSQDYQLCARLYKSLSELSALDLLYPQLEFKKARHIFNELLNTTIFQAQSLPAPIQILGTLESAGFHFDAIWITGMHDEAWPAAAKPNPFLPYEFQTKNNMPHASSSRELEYAKHVLQRLFQSAPTIIVSVPLRDGDKILQPSELIAEVESFPEPSSWNCEALSGMESSSEPENTGSRIQCGMTDNPNLEFIDDHVAPSLSSEENIRGGSWIIKQQAICPFRAFASVRLQAAALPEPSLGLSPSERGILLHRCLEKIWNALRDQRTLASKNSTELSELIDKITSNVIHTFENRQAKAHEKFLKTEKKRLDKLLFQWLEFEKNRDPFSVVATESQFTVPIGNLHLKIQVDRIDQLENGEYLIIDYKTGACTINDWLGERPQDPQLPLYCSFTRHQNQPYSGISFAEFKPGKLQFKGLLSGDEEARSPVPGVMNTASWDSHVRHWREIIQELSEEFSAGTASVTPFDSHSCDFCDLHSLCRVNA